MNKLRSEVLFNRALLWMLFTGLMHQMGNKHAMLYLVPAVWCLVESALVWSKEDA